MKRVIIICIYVTLILLHIDAQYITTNATRIQNDFNNNWNNGQFPRLFGGQDEIQRVKNLYNSGDHLIKKTVDAIIAEANTAINKAIPIWGLDAANLRVSSVHTIAKEFVPQLVIAYLITDDTKYAKRAWEVAKVLMTYQDWGVATTSPYKDRHFLDAGIGAFNAAMLYDGLYKWTNQAQKDSLYTMTRKYIFVPSQAQYNGTAQRTWNWMSANNNWNGICNGGVIAACLTMFEHDKSLLSDIASRAINFLANYINAFEPDGQSDEGLMYWSYGLMYTTTALDIMKRVLSTTYGYGETNGMRKTGYFPIYTSGPVATLNVGDDGVRSARQNTIMWFSKHLNDANLAKFSYDLFMENGQKMNWFDLFHYSPELVASGTELTVGLDNYVRGIDLYSFIERWKDRNAMYLAVHAGDNKANHGHLDAGSFYIQALGEYWAFGNLGGDSYTSAGYFDLADKANNDATPTYTGNNTAPTSSQRWHFYRLRAEGKNTVVFNPDFRADQNPREEAVFRGFINSSEKVGSGSINLNMIYSRDVNSFTRGFKLDRARRVITIHDNIAAKSNKNIWWSMHTRATIVLSADKKEATLSQNGKSMKFVIRSPENAEFQSLNATYLDGRNFPLTTNGSNGNYRKLAINLSNTKDVSIRIEAYPTLDGDKEELIDDFESISYVYTSNSNTRIEYNIANPSKTSTNESDLVMKVTKLSGANNQSGVRLSNKKINIGLGSGQYRYLKIKVLKQTNSPVKIVLNNTSNAQSAVYYSVNNASKIGEWEEFRFDLLTDASTLNREGETFDQLTIVPEETETALIETFIDDIRLTNVIDSNPENIAFSQQKVNQLGFSDRTNSSLKLKWNHVANASQYVVYRDKQIFATVANTEIEVPQLSAGTLYTFSVTALNTNGQASLSSDLLYAPARKLSENDVVVDDFENAFIPWVGTVTGANLTAFFNNPIKSTVNTSEKCMRMSRMAYSSNNTGIELTNTDLFELDKLPRFLNVKLYRGAIGSGVAIELVNRNNGAILRRNKPLNEADTLQTLKWVDFVFDLQGEETENVYHTLKIIPDLTTTHSSTRNFFIDDVRFSTTGIPYTSVSKHNKNELIGNLKRINKQIYFSSDYALNSKIKIHDLTGRMIKAIDYNAGSGLVQLTGGLQSGTYILSVTNAEIGTLSSIITY